MTPDDDPTSDGSDDDPSDELPQSRIYAQRRADQISRKRRERLAGGGEGEDDPS